MIMFSRQIRHFLPATATKPEFSVMMIAVDQRVRATRTNSKHIHDSLNLI